nr:MAG TPA: hypothetical protein [Caudoviricetes sp.]
MSAGRAARARRARASGGTGWSRKIACGRSPTPGHGGPGGRRRMVAARPHTMRDRWSSSSYHDHSISSMASMMLRYWCQPGPANRPSRYTRGACSAAAEASTSSRTQRLVSVGRRR